VVEHRFVTPVKPGDVSKLKIGDIVYLSGKIFTARDFAHMKIIENGPIKGFDTKGLALYHCGPVVKKLGKKWNILSAGPTTSARMDALEPKVLETLGVKLIIGKGGMGHDTLKALKKNNAAYLTMTGGIGALATKMLGKVKDVYYLDELGPVEAIWVFEANSLGPLFVTMDSHGNSFYDFVESETKKNLDRILSVKFG